MPNGGNKHSWAITPVTGTGLVGSQLKNDKTKDNNLNSFMIYIIDYKIYKEKFEAHREEYKNYPEYEKIKSICCCEIDCINGPQESICITSDDPLFQKALEVAIFCKNYIFASCTSYDSISLYKNDEKIDDFDSYHGIFRYLLGEEYTDRWKKINLKEMLNKLQSSENNNIK